MPGWGAVNFYVDLVKAHGEAGAPQAGFTECLNNTMQGKTAMWYGATSAAGSLESADSPNKGKFGYVAAPVKETASSGWLYTWAWAVQKASKNQDNAGKFIAWASSVAAALLWKHALYNPEYGMLTKIFSRAGRWMSWKPPASMGRVPGRSSPT